MDDHAAILEHLASPAHEWRKNAWWRVLGRGCVITNRLRDWTERRKSIDYKPKRYPGFRYDALPTPRSFRLLRLHYVDDAARFILATMVTREMDDCDEYLALSYTWGATEIEKDDGSDRFLLRYSLYLLHESDCDDIVTDHIRTPELNNPGWCSHLLSQISISQTLSDFLVYYVDNIATHHGADRTIWIDAVCINQEDRVEVLNQIKHMGDIYHNAGCVCVWLGRQTEGLEAFRWMSDHVFPALAEKRPKEEEWETYAARLCKNDPTDAVFWRDFVALESQGANWLQDWDEFLRYIQRKEWFKRCWITQEYALAKVVVYICGPTPIVDRTRALVYFRDWIVEIELRKGYSYGLTPVMELFEITIDHISPYADEPGCLMAYYGDNTTERSPLELAVDYLTGLVRYTRERECGYPADRIFSVLGIVCRLLGKSEIIYPGVEALFDRALPVPIFIWAATLDCEYVSELGMLSSIEPISDRKLIDLPSWVPDFSTSLGCIPIKNTGCDATMVRSVSVEKPRVRGSTLTLRARCIGAVSESYPACLAAMAFPDAEDNLIPMMKKEVEDNNEAGNLEDVFDRWVVKNTIFPIRKKIRKAGSNKIKSILGNVQTNAPAMSKYVQFLYKWAVLIHDCSNREQVRITSLFHPKEVFRYSLNLEKCVFARSLFLTNESHAAIGPEAIEPNDTLWLFEGGPHAYILRENEGKGNYSFIGDCYVLGIMNGEMMAPEFRASFASIDIV